MAYSAPYLDDKGIHMPTYEDRLADLSEACRSIYGAETQLSEAVPDYQLLSIFSRALDDASALTLQAYNSRNPMYAAGEALDLLLPQYGMTRGVSESDASVRARILQFMAEKRADPAGRITGAVLAVPDVLQARVYVNDTDEVDERGAAPHSISVVFDSGRDEDVARAVFDSKPPGIAACGSTVVNVTDAFGVLHPVGITRITPKFVIVSVHIRLLPGGSREQIEEAVVPAMTGFINSVGIDGMLNIPQLYGVGYAAMPDDADTFVIRDIQVLVRGTSSIVRDMIAPEWNEAVTADGLGGVNIIWDET